MPGPQQFVGLVTAARRMPKTITVTVQRKKEHPVVGKMIRRRTRMLTHDEHNLADVGDTVSIINCPPKSAAKRHSLLEIIKKARVVGGIREGADTTQTLSLHEVEEAERRAHQDADDAHKEHVEQEAVQAKEGVPPPEPVLAQQQARQQT